MVRRWQQSVRKSGVILGAFELVPRSPIMNDQPFQFQSWELLEACRIVLQMTPHRV
jgi:hypothetical protein